MWWGLLLLFLVVVAFLILIFAFLLRSKPEKIPDKEAIDEFLEVIRRRVGFSKPQAVSTARGKCLDYIFPEALTLNVDKVDSLQPIPSSLILDCLDEDTASLIKVYSTCQEDYCLNFNGERIEKGESIVFYERCANGLLPCYEYDESYLASISVGDSCLKRVEKKVVPAVCSLLDKEQLWRVNRALPFSLIGNSQSPLARIYNRISGKCLVPTIYPPREGTTLEEGDCFPNKGYVWWLIPPVHFTEAEEGFLSSPQLVYTENATDFPENLVDYFDRYTPLSVHLIEGKFILLPYKKRPSTSCFLQINKYTNVL